MCAHRTGSPLSFKRIRTTEPAADAQHQHREARNSWSPCVPPDDGTNPGRDGRERGGHAVKEGAVSPQRSHGEPGCGSARLNPCGRANWIGVAAPSAAGAREERPGPAQARRPTAKRRRTNRSPSPPPKSMSIVAEQPPRWSRPGQHFPKI